MPAVGAWAPVGCKGEGALVLSVDARPRPCARLTSRRGRSSKRRRTSSCSRRRWRSRAATRTRRAATPNTRSSRRRRRELAEVRSAVRHRRGRGLRPALGRRQAGPRVCGAARADVAARAARAAPPVGHAAVPRARLGQTKGRVARSPSSLARFEPSLAPSSLPSLVDSRRAPRVIAAEDARRVCRRRPALSRSERKPPRCAAHAADDGSGVAAVGAARRPRYRCSTRWRRRGGGAPRRASTAIESVEGCWTRRPTRRGRRHVVVALADGLRAVQGGVRRRQRRRACSLEHGTGCGDGEGVAIPRVLPPPLPPPRLPPPRRPRREIDDEIACVANAYACASTCPITASSTTAMSSASASSAPPPRR